ncbi:MAG: hypothetical protein LKJ80_02025 [Oscillibacter sp.]|jgi:phage gp46-like protein|nr:hypothetical protein [Oscillibacter sp.]
MLKIRNGDYVPDGTGGLARCESASEELLQQALLRLSAHRGALPFWEDFGSRLWQLGRLSAAERPAAAKQYAAESLADLEELSVTGVTLGEPRDGALPLTVELACGDEKYAVELAVR